MATEQTAQAVRVLIVEDEPSIRRFLKASLASHGYAVFEAQDAQEGLEGSVSSHPDVIILDLGLPDLDGLEVITRIRVRSTTPIIILSVREDESDKVMALDAGADDYLTKPFREGELLARLRAVLRRFALPEEAAVFRIGHLTVDFSRHLVHMKDQVVGLTPTEYELLKVLVSHAGKVVTHRQLLREVWNKTEDYEGGSHLLRVTVSNLRNKLEPQPERPTYILTEPGVGYRLHADSF
ncbi:MAG: response regulator transcription factor [Candidatus Latescibacteria bacterium]|nr:response regulator transcription factor [Candidatus Latescibacterota bacterium]